jgi:2-keto-4-pentenoate hydratase
MNQTGNQGRALAAARRAGASLAALPGALPHDEAAAYAIQAAAIAAYEDTRVGYKIGATSSAAQASFGTDHPFCAPLFGTDCHADGSTLTAPEYGLLGIEAEFAFRLGSDLPARPEPYTPGEMEAAVESVHPAFEIVGLRLPRELFTNMAVVIADFGANVAFVHGDTVDDWASQDLATVAVRVDIDGETVATGSGAAVLGHPLNALLWLAERCRTSGAGLGAGDYISTGACCGIIQITPGQTATADFGALGNVAMTMKSG